MKRTFLIVSILTWAFMLNAQENDYNYVFNNKNGKPEISFYGGLISEHHSSITNTKPGIEAGIVLNQSFAIGAYGQGTLTNFNTSLNDKKYYNILGEGGLLLSYTANSNKRLHFGGLLKIGYAALASDDEEMIMFKSVNAAFEDGGWVYHPEVFAELNLHKSMKVRLGVGYSIYNLSEEHVVSSADINCFTVNLGLLFGKFGHHK
jgi:hypothetical protein